MPIPLLALAASKAATAAKAAKVASVASKASKVSKVANAAPIAKRKLSIGMLADDKVNSYPGMKAKAKGFVEGAANNSKEVKFSEPTKADLTSIPSNNPNQVYGEQIQKLKSLND